MGYIIFILIIFFSDIMKVSLTAGKAEGPYKLNAFDNALLDAGIGDVNLIKVSSILPPDTQLQDLPKFDAGSMINCVLAHAYSDKEGDLISAVISVAIGEDLGCVVENSGINRDPTHLRKEAEHMVQHMMSVRGKDIKELYFVQENHIVRNKGAVIAALVYW